MRHRFPARLALGFLLLVAMFAVSGLWAAVAPPDCGCGPHCRCEGSCCCGPKEGYYAVSGNMPNGDPYELLGSVRKLNRVYQVSWFSGDAIHGVGVFESGRLSVGYAVPLAPGKVQLGSAVFTPTTKGLRGTWAVLPGSGTTGSERWEWLRGVPKLERRHETRLNE